jgi:hypothetical protein
MTEQIAHRAPPGDGIRERGSVQRREPPREGVAALEIERRGLAGRRDASQVA